MYSKVAHFFRKHALVCSVILFSVALSACGNKGPLTVPDTLSKKNMVNALFINNNNDA